MIRVIFSYVKSAVVFCVMLCVIAAGVTATVLFTDTTTNLIIRLVGFAVFLIAVYAVTIVYVLKLISNDITRLGENECKIGEVCELLNKLVKRASFKGYKALLLINYTDYLIYKGDYARATEAASDAVASGKKDIKGEAAIRFCKIFFMQNDPDYFSKYYNKAIDALNKTVNAKKQTSSVITYANMQINVLTAMQLYLQGKAEEAAAKVRSASGVTELQKNNLNKLLGYIEGNKEE